MNLSVLFYLIPAMADEYQIFKYGRFPMIFQIIIYILMLVKSIKSEVYTVGDDYGWNSGSADFGSWSQKYNFTIGDVLEFKYVRGQHNVYEVTQETFRSCDGSTGVLATYESGNDEISLNETKKYWFICNIAGHCLGGMRFTIDVQEGTNDPTSKNNTTSNNTTDFVPTPEVLEPDDGYCVRFALAKWVIGVYLFTFAILLES